MKHVRAALRGGGPPREDVPVQRPETRFAWNGDVSLAYQVLGSGSTDLVYLQGYCSNVDLNWESPRLARFLRGLSEHARVIATDRRGWGCSERFTPGYVPDVDTLTDDLLAVLEAAGSERAAILATHESAIVASLFAATYPERVKALILVVSCERCSAGTAAPRSTRLAMGSSLPSTGPRAPFAAPSRSWSPCGRWGSTSAPASIPGKSRASAARSAASP